MKTKERIRLYKKNSNLPTVKLVELLEFQNRNSFRVWKSRNKVKLNDNVIQNDNDNVIQNDNDNVIQNDNDNVIQNDNDNVIQNDNRILERSSNLSFIDFMEYVKNNKDKPIVSELYKRMFVNKKGKSDYMKVFTVLNEYIEIR